MNDTVLGALIAGVCGVLIAVVSGLIKCFLDVLLIPLRFINWGAVALVSF